MWLNVGAKDVVILFMSDISDNWVVVSFLGREVAIYLFFFVMLLENYLKQKKCNIELF